MTTLAAVVTEQGHDTATGATIIALSILALLLWAVAEGLLTRARRKVEDRDALAVSVGVLSQPNPYLRPWADRRPGDLDGGAA